MPSCLGIYIESNIIKYAKVSKEKETVKIEASGIKFYDNLRETVETIIEETNSYKIPISINLSDESYTYTELFSLLNKKDLEKAANTEFEYFCTDNGKNKNAIEHRKLFVENIEDKDKKGVLYAYIDKTILTSKVQNLDGLALTSVVPLPVAIANLNDFKGTGNSIIVNIEKLTKVTTIINGEIQRINAINRGMQEILENVNLKENSYEKAYEICKNSTIYTSEGQNLEIEENEHLDNIMPTLYSIIQEVKNIISSETETIDNIYITGLGAVINNIDLYFQENFANQKCEILTPYFAQKTNIKLNIKDYIEVNSATALALQGLGEGHKEVNFVKGKSLNKFSGLLTVEVSSKKKSGSTNKKISDYIKFDLGTKLDNYERYMLRTAIGLLIIVVLYSIIAKIVMGQISNKNNEITSFIEETNSEITKVADDRKIIEKKVSQYEEIINRIDENAKTTNETIRRKNSIPNMLNNIMFAIPTDVQLLSVSNTSGKKIQIEAQAMRYEELGYFIAQIKTDAILLNVTSTSGIKEEDNIKIIITGDLPY